MGRLKSLDGWVALRAEGGKENAFFGGMQVVQVVTVEVSVASEGIPLLSCSSMAGEELASLQLEDWKTLTIKELHCRVTEQCGPSSLVTVSGRAILSADDALLVEQVFDFQALR